VKKDILTLLDLTETDFDALLDRAIELKEMQKSGISYTPLKGKTLGLIFNKASTRTRLSFEAAMVQLGGHPIFIGEQDTQIARDEPVSDTARVVSRYLDGLAIRTYSQDLLKAFAEYASIPVINALTDMYHPCQILSDIQTIIECKGGYKDLKIAWVGDGNNVAHSWINAAAVIDLHIELACPPDYQPRDDIVKQAASTGRGCIRLLTDPIEAVKDADVVYTDVWASMGQEREHQKRKLVFAPYQVTQALVEHARPDAIVMHCLPAHRNEEISTDVLEGPASVVWDQAENKMHMAKAILERLLSSNCP